MRKSHLVCAILVAVFLPWGLSFAETAKEFNDKGEAAYKAKDYAKAVEYYTEVIKLEPGRHETIYARGVNYYKLKKFDEALTDFNKVKDVKKIDHHALNYIGMIYMTKEDYSTAFNAFKDAANLEPKSILYSLNAARAAVKTDNRASALTYYKQALKVDPKNQEATRYVDHEKRASEIRQQAAAEKRGQQEFLQRLEPYREKGFPRIVATIPPSLSTLEAVFGHCYDKKISAEIGINYLAELGIGCAKRDPGAGGQGQRCLLRYCREAQ